MARNDGPPGKYEVCVRVACKREFLHCIFQNFDFLKDLVLVVPILQHSFRNIGGTYVTFAAT